MKNSLLYIAIFLLALSIPFRGNEKGADWMWTYHPWVPLIFVICSILCIGLYLYQKESLKKH